MFGVAHHAIMIPWRVEQPMLEEHGYGILSVGFCVNGFVPEDMSGPSLWQRDSILKGYILQPSHTVQNVKMEGRGGVRGVQLGSLVWPLGLHHKGSTPGFSVWSLITHTTGPFVVACVPSTACCRACFKCSLCVTAAKEQRRSVRAVRRSAAAAKNTTWRESHVGAKRFHSKLS